MKPYNIIHASDIIRNYVMIAITPLWFMPIAGAQESTEKQVTKNLFADYIPLFKLMDLNG